MTFYLNQKQKSLIKEHYQNYKVDNKNSSYELFQYHNITIEIYQEKVIFKGTKEDIIAEYRRIWNQLDENQSPVIGNAEFGINNFFGPLVIISSYIGSGNLEKLRLLNIRDYKDLSQSKFIELAQDIMKTIIFESVIINNRKYNQWIDAGYSPNIIKTWGENQALVRMLQHRIQYDTIVIDQYINEDTYYKYIENMKDNRNKIIKDKVQFVTNAENKYLAIACSTIISRYLFLEEIKKIKGIDTNTIPLGTGKEVNIFLEKIKNEKTIEFNKFLERHSKKSFTEFFK
ncbi:ribonuclease HIII [Spiroplasma endosymbiont of Danaus chrysippus]|uniref:ribonuclease HIII n=1 Tax=Spiroplasma endosymbiont of Danaus chrysippus TaxID=2691041 RepID=UPI0013C57101|nr:ribonuclease HIII [Spiroplasma endosymbiont of Danaus chrysippus]CAB1053473.1 Ribonuclease HIII (EC 3.1.26.4) [Spiroplasma endosymbiont of Danaus chrysippus]